MVQTFPHPLCGQRPSFLFVGIYKKRGCQIAQKKSLDLPGGIFLSGRHRKLLIFFHHPIQYGFRMAQPLQLVGIGNALIHITDPVFIHEQVKGGDASGMAAGEGGILMVLIEHMLRQADAILPVKLPAVSNAVESQAPVEALPVGHDFLQRVGFSGLLRITLPVFYFTGSNVNGPVVGQHHVTVTVFQKPDKRRKIFGLHPVVSINDLQVLTCRRGAAGVQRPAVALVLLTDQSDRAGIFLRPSGGDFRSPVLGAVIYQDNIQFAEEGKMRKQLREWALKSYAHAVDPNSPDYLLWRKEGQPLVDAAYIAESFLRAYDQLWKPLDETTKKRYIEEFTLLRRVDPPYTNWLLFSSIIESFLAKTGAPYDAYRVNSACRKMEEWYVGDGWYADGPVFAFDYYSSYVFHPMYLETLQAMKDAKAYTRIHYGQYYDRALERCQKFSIVLERLISPEGTFPVFGRSIPYRMAAMQPLALMAWYQRLPGGLTNGQVRSALTATMKSMYNGKENFNEGGFLTIGFCGRQPNVADWYTNNGSLYMTSLSLLPLGLPATHPFWTDAPADWTSKKAWSGQPFPKDHQWKDQIVTKDLF